MIVKAYGTPGKGKKGRHYAILEGDSILAYFEDLKTAGIVVRFLKGAHMEKQDYTRAVDALSEWDEAHGGQGKWAGMPFVCDADAGLDEETDSSDSI